MFCPDGVFSFFIFSTEAFKIIYYFLFSPFLCSIFGFLVISASIPPMLAPKGAPGAALVPKQHVNLFFIM